MICSVGGLEYYLHSGPIDLHGSPNCRGTSNPKNRASKVVCKKNGYFVILDNFVVKKTDKALFTDSSLNKSY